MTNIVGKVCNVGRLSLCLLCGIAFGGSTNQTTTAAGASWPAKIFAPYAFIPKNFPNITNCLSETGQKYYTLAFVISDEEGQPAWTGATELRTSGGYYAPEIEDLRAHGGDVLVSFGGEGGTELALNTPTVAALEAKYQSVIGQYSLKWLDFDIEGRALSNVEANQRRNAALKQLQSKNPGLKISFTLPVNPTGLRDESLTLLKDAGEKGLAIESVNIMTMDYGANVSRGRTMGDLAVAAAKATHAQLEAIAPGAKIGLTPMIGQNDVKVEIFTLDDARTLMDFARKTLWIRSVSFWAVYRDKPRTAGKGGGRGSGVEQEKWEFTKIFQGFP